MSHALNENIHLHLHLYLLGLWQENPSQGMSHHLCRESLPCLLPKTQMPTMTDAPLQGERAPALDRDPEPFLETPRPVERVPFPSPGELHDPGIEPGSPTLQAEALPSEPPGKKM